MKKVLCALLMLAMMACFTMAMAEECKYAGEGSPCDVGWWIDTEKRMHARACFYHVEDKEDMDSHVLITDWEACTLDEGGECTTCGWDYVRESTGGDIPEEDGRLPDGELSTPVRGTGLCAGGCDRVRQHPDHFAHG